MSTLRWAAIAFMHLAVSSGAAGAQPEPPPIEPPAAADAQPAPVMYADRLATLSPARPLGYFELAEEVAAEDRTAAGRSLARRLFVLALHTPRRFPAVQRPEASLPADGAPPWLAASACLGLAALAESEQERRWLIALAGTLTPVDAAVAVRRQSEEVARDPAALELATAIGLIRSGEGRRAARILEKPAVAAMLTRYEGLMSPGGISGGGDRLRMLSARHPLCPECRNRRSIRNADGIRLCTTCQGRPGPRLSFPEIVGQLRLESLLLNGVQRSWAAQAVADGGAPMRELDPDVLIDVYGVDPAQALWRDGRWIAPPGAATPPDQPDPQPMAEPDADRPAPPDAPPTEDEPPA